ncbi:helix-turn-helix transcriptional regulator [Sphingobium phenoxybenzoativorans]|uniref:Helix-turn-helix transcriptional regulator n=2 Tax=Sphingobium phenoxybenzoativorans TaxID=1592790 RepID=A0A975K4V1_9SPHN|nr:helix-turn-helix transcriptional regulator [Sphingobium phenoxybenzoativorans]
MTQSELAEKLGITKEFVSMMERGRTIEPRTALAVQRLFDTTPRLGPEGGIPTTLVERMACAIYGQKVGNPNYWGAVTEAEIKEARAALAALRQPTEAILKAMRDTVPIDGHEWEYVESGAAEHWQAMIDAALAEEG